jgi:HSP20 family protein
LRAFAASLSIAIRKEDIPMTNMISNRRTGMPTLLGWDPLRLFDDLLKDLERPATGGQTIWSAAPVHVQHDDDRVQVTVDMPGVDPENLDLTLEAGSLTIAGQRGERSYRYAVALGHEYDASSIEAQLDKGVLTITAAKRPDAKPRKIALKGSGQKSLESGDSK